MICWEGQLTPAATGDEFSMNCMQIKNDMIPKGTIMKALPIGVCHITMSWTKRKPATSKGFE